MKKKKNIGVYAIMAYGIFYTIIDPNLETENH